MSEQRKKIRDRIKRLLSMTVENGASEAEALVAAQKASDLMAEHNLSFRSVAEIEAEEYGGDKRDWFRGSKGFSRSAPVPFTRWCLFGISELCGVEHCYNTHTGRLEFFGAEQDTEAAHYLEEIIRRAMDREWQDFKRLRGHGRGRSSFYHAMASRIASRLLQMSKDQRQKTEAGQNGTNLVVLKNALLQRRFADAHPRLREGNFNPTLNDAAAFVAGRDAGDRAQLNRGVNQAVGAKALT